MSRVTSDLAYLTLPPGNSGSQYTPHHVDYVPLIHLQQPSINVDIVMIQWRLFDDSEHLLSSTRYYYDVLDSSAAFLRPCRPNDLSTDLDITVWYACAAHCWPPD